ncbi:AAA family ATPase [Listeria welshimeri]|nr:AAA family ATPase [Listeria welshimeri]MBC2334525.1 AAA family ATPase [Listeria welshimeri]
MYLSNLKIKNFRNYKSGSFDFKKGTNTIVGENDAGKSNALTALRVLLDDSYYYGKKTLKESDFSYYLGDNWRGEWIIISATFGGITEEDMDNEICSTLSIAKIDEIDEEENIDEVSRLLTKDTDGIGSLTLYIRPNKNIRKKLYDSKDIAEFEKIRENIRLVDYEFYYTSKSDYNFLLDDNYSRLVGNLNEGLASNPSDDDSAKLGAKIDMIDIYQHISVVYIDALRDVLREMKTSKNPIRRIIEAIESNIEVNRIEGVKEKIKALNDEIVAIPQINGIGNSLNSELKDILGSVYSPDLSLSSNMSDEISSLSKFLSMRSKDDDELELLGLGHLNMIYLALKIVEFESCRSRELLNIMLIEEPEAHIHRHIQKTLFDGLSIKEGYTQLIMTTHSVHLAESSEISRMNIIKSYKKQSIVMSPSNELNLFASEKLQKKMNLAKNIERYLDVKRNGLLFSKGVVLAEGDAEEILIPNLVKKTFGISLDEIGIGLINIGSTAFEYVASLFDEKRIMRYCAIITDLDQQAIPKDSSMYKKKAEEKGIERQKKLNRLFEDNKWVDMFYANTTFEIEFADENTEYITQLVTDTFSQEDTINDYNDKLLGEDIDQRNLSVLRLANKLGKGWFAIEISNIIDESVSIPNYILNALAFASQESMSIAIYLKLIKYELLCLDKGEQVKDIEVAQNSGNDIKDIVKKYIEENDYEVSYFINACENYLNLLDEGVS